jgi:hypothetical protein
MPQRNLAVELPQKLLKGEIKARAKRNVVQARSFADLLEQAIRKCQNRAIETAQMIEELIALARYMRKAGEPRRGARHADPVGLTPAGIRHSGCPLSSSLHRTPETGLPSHCDCISFAVGPWSAPHFSAGDMNTPIAPSSNCVLRHQLRQRRSVVLLLCVAAVRFN